MSDTHDVLFRPYLTVRVRDGKVVGTEWDWSDTVVNVSLDGELVWEDDGAMLPPVAQDACDWLDRQVAAGKTEIV